MKLYGKGLMLGIWIKPATISPREWRSPKAGERKTRRSVIYDHLDTPSPKVTRSRDTILLLEQRNITASSTAKGNQRVLCYPMFRTASYCSNYHSSIILQWHNFYLVTFYQFFKFKRNAEQLPETPLLSQVLYGSS